MIIPKTKYRKLQIGVIGDSSCSKRQLDIAYDLGKKLAKKNFAVLCGGRGGIMKGKKGLLSIFLTHEGARGVRSFI